MRGPTQTGRNPPNGWMKCIQLILTVTYNVTNGYNSYYYTKKGENTVDIETNTPNMQTIANGTENIPRFVVFFIFKGIFLRTNLFSKRVVTHHFVVP